MLNFFGNFRKVYVGEQAMHSSKVYVQLSERMGLHDHLMVMNLTVTKITMNLKSFAQCSAKSKVTCSTKVYNAINTFFNREVVKETYKKQKIQCF